MMSFEMNAEVALEFYRRCKELGWDTEEQRTMLLVAMAQEGLIKRVVQTDRTKEQYIADLKKNFGVIDLTKPAFDPEATIDAVWTRDSETGEFVLLDRKTNKEIARRLP